MKVGMSFTADRRARLILQSKQHPRRNFMLKKFLKVSLVIGAAVASLSLSANAQTVKLNIIGSSAYWLEAGLGANFSGTVSNPGLIKATCVWSENTNTVAATDTSVSPSAVDKGSAWVAWTTGTGGTCAAPSSSSLVYAYLNTDSVVGNRCLFNSTTCTIAFPTGNPAPANQILTGGVANCGTTGECALPTTVTNVLNTFKKANVAASDIRPEDAEFAIARAQKPCGTAVASGSQYLGLGYTNGGTLGVINSAIPSSTKTFNVVNFSLPTGTNPYNVTLVGATALVVAVHGDGTSTGFATSGNLTNSQLAKLLDGTTQTTPNGGAANVLVREPLSGTYNTMEYNIPNASGNTLGITPASANKTSQDVGLNQAVAQRNCNSNGTGTSAVTTLKFVNATTGATRLRAIGTGEELAEVGSFANASGGTNNIGYGFWSLANYTSLGAVSNTGYYKIDNVDPLTSSATGCSYTGVLPVSGTALKCVDMHNVANGTYPIWSLLRMVNTDTTVSGTIQNLATSTQKFVSFNSTTARPDFIVPAQLQVVRSHFIPPIGTGEPTVAANGDFQLGDGSSACIANELGGDVGGIVLTLTADSANCNGTSKTGQTAERR
jgi:hypothetical protein